jgi:drug/metabolite transporter (DMT)-like permease
MLAKKGIKQLDGLSNLFYTLFLNPFGSIASLVVAVSTLVATVYGLVKHRSRPNLWWIIGCAVISVIAFVIIGLILCAMWYIGSHAE